MNDVARLLPPRTVLGWIALAWGVGGVVVMLGSAVWRLFPIALVPFEDDAEVTLSTVALYGASIVLLGYSEGYRAFHRQFSPRVVARGLALAAEPRLVYVLLAPLYCMGHFHATRRRIWTAWLVAAGIVLLVALTKAMDQPWRGAVDAGVVVGLSMGLVSILGFSVTALAGRVLPVSPDLPGEDA